MHAPSAVLCGNMRAWESPCRIGKSDGSRSFQVQTDWSRFFQVLLRPLGELLQSGRALIGLQLGGGVCNGLIAAPAYAAFIQRWLTEYAGYAYTQPPFLKLYTSTLLVTLFTKDE